MQHKVESLALRTGDMDFRSESAACEPYDLG